MKLSKKAGYLLCLLLPVSVSYGQKINYFGVFPTIDHSGSLSPKWGYNIYLFDAIKPYTNTINGATDEARSFYGYGELGLSYALTKQLSITGAYVHERQNVFKDYYRTENRLFQQLTLKSPVNNGTIKQRLRFDERFIQNRTTGEAPLTHRLRYLLGGTIPIADTKLYATGYSEFFFNTSNAFTYEENWSALQLGIHLNQVHSIEAGLLNVNWIYNNSNDWLHQYYLQATWVSHLDFLHK